MNIRMESKGDKAGVYAVNVSTFKTSSEADLVDILRKVPQPDISLVAEEDGNIVGHIMFSPLSLTGHPDLNIMALAPMAVMPEHQKKGIGSAMVREGLEQCRQRGVAAVIVLGHPEYYPRFGFVPASRFGIDSIYQVPEGVFMAMELNPDALLGKSGRVLYPAAFGKL